MPPFTTYSLVPRYSVTTGSAGNTTASNASASLGKYVSTTVIPSAAMNNLFDDVNEIEHHIGADIIRCVFLVNEHPSIACTAYVALLAVDFSEPYLVERFSLASDNIAASAIGSSAAQADSTTDLVSGGEATTYPPTDVGPWRTDILTPAGVTAGEVVGVPLGLIAPGQCKAFWVRRLAIYTEPAAVVNDGTTLLFTSVL